MEVLLHTCQFPDEAFKIPKHLDDGISLALSKLKTLLLDHLSGDAFPPRTRDVHKSDPIPGLTPGFFLSRFLVKTPALEHLRLNFQLYGYPSIEKVLSWLANTSEDSTVSTSLLVDSLELANVISS